MLVTGIRAYDCTDKNLSFVSIVDIPEVKSSYRLFLEQVSGWAIDFIVFCFDASQNESYQTMRAMFESMQKFSGERVVVALRMELIPDQDDLRTLMARATLEEAVRWAGEMKLKIFEISLAQNIGVNQLFQYVTKP